jgi:hypothetical protein
MNTKQADLYDRYALGVSNVAMKYLHSEPLTEEIVIEVFTELFEKLDDLHTSIEIEAFLIKTTIKHLKIKSSSFKPLTTNGITQHN